MLAQEADGANTNMYLWTQLRFPDECIRYARWKQQSSSSPVVVPANAQPPLFYYNPLLQRFRFKPLPLLRGGWNVEEMGLGKVDSIQPTPIVPAVLGVPLMFPAVLPCVCRLSAQTIGALALINVQRKTMTAGEKDAMEEDREEKEEANTSGRASGRGRAKAKKAKPQPLSRDERYHRRSSSKQKNDDDDDDDEHSEEEKEEKEEREDKDDDDDREEKMAGTDDEDDFVDPKEKKQSGRRRHSPASSTSSSPSSSSSSSPAPSSSSLSLSSSSSSSSPSSSPVSTYLEESVDKVDPQGRIYTACTLVVCPVSLVGQWYNELIEKSSRPLKILLYHGGGRPRKVEKLLGYDVIITSYGIASSELTLGNNRVKGLVEKAPWLYKGQYAPEYQSLLNRFHWHRVSALPSLAALVHRRRLSLCC